MLQLRCASGISLSHCQCVFHHSIVSDPRSGRSGTPVSEHSSACPSLDPRPSTIASLSTTGARYQHLAAAARCQYALYSVLSLFSFIFTVIFLYNFLFIRRNHHCTRIPSPTPHLPYHRFSITL